MNLNGDEYQVMNNQNGGEYQNPSGNIILQLEEEDDDDLALSLSFGPKEPSSARRNQIQPLPILEPGPMMVARPPRVGGGLRGARRNPSQAPRGGKSPIVPAPYPWATTQRATVHSKGYLQSHNITTITGDVQCKRCEKRYEIDYDLVEKFTEILRYILVNKEGMRDRAPSEWMSPVLPACKFCRRENSAKPVISEKKKSINWLFLFLGQTLGCCTLEQLKYFCKHTKNHRTGAKDRVLYLTYLDLCKQLEPCFRNDR